jgi:hypothetical protein
MSKNDKWGKDKNCNTDNNCNENKPKDHRPEVEKCGKEMNNDMHHDMNKDMHKEAGHKKSSEHSNPHQGQMNNNQWDKNKNSNCEQKPFNKENKDGKGK